MKNNGTENRDCYWNGRVHSGGAGLFEDQV